MCHQTAGKSFREWRWVIHCTHNVNKLCLEFCREVDYCDKRGILHVSRFSTRRIYSRDSKNSATWLVAETTKDHQLGHRIAGFGRFARTNSLSRQPALCWCLSNSESNLHAIQSISRCRQIYAWSFFNVSCVLMHDQSLAHIQFKAW